MLGEKELKVKRNKNDSVQKALWGGKVNKTSNLK